MTLSTIGIELIWSLSLGVMIWLLIALVFGDKLPGPLVLLFSGIITILTFFGAVVFEIQSGLSFILGTGFTAMFNGVFSFYTLPFIWATWAILLLVVASIWAFVVQITGKILS